VDEPFGAVDPIVRTRLQDELLTLQFVDKNQSPSTDPTKTYAALTAALKNEGVTAYKASAAEDKNGFVVTEATAKKYNLKTLSDLAKPAS